MVENGQKQQDSGEMASIQVSTQAAMLESSGLPAMPEGPMKVVGRVVVVVADIAAPNEAAQRLREVLASESHEIAWTTPRDVLYGREEIVADAVILDATATDIQALGERLKRATRENANDATETMPLLALIGENMNLEALAASGIDDFIHAHASDTEIHAHLALAIRLGRAERDLHITREELSHQIQIDDLSGTLNRRFFFQAAYRECSRARRYDYALSCLMVDIDHFNLYNTTFGYGCGDSILREVANILKTSVRDTDLVARFGGSKFVVLLTHTDTEGATTVRQKIESSIQGGYFLWEHQRLPVTVSIGEVQRVPGRSHPLAPEDGEEDAAPLSTREDLAELLEDADSALYIAKKGALLPAFFRPY